MASYPIKMMKDENNKPFVPLVSTEGIKNPQGQTLDSLLNTKIGPSNLHGGDNISVTTSGYDCFINLDLPSSLNVIDNLNTSVSGQGALDARQGKILKDSIPIVDNDISSTSTTHALSAYQGYVLNQKFNDYTLTSALEDLIKQYILASHPIGSIEINISGANPSTYLGGTWITWGTGKVPVGINTSDTDFNTVEKTGGEKEHVLTITEMPKHTHKDGTNPNEGIYAQSGSTSAIVYYNQASSSSRPTTETGGDQPHNNLQPYITCYMWKRTA